VIDHKLTVAYIAGIAESFKTDLFVIWSQDDSDKPIIRCRVLGGADKDDGDGMGEEDIFLHQLENTMLHSVSLCGVKDIKRVFLLEHDKATISDDGTIEARKEKEWVLETDGVNLKTVTCVDGVDFQRTYSNGFVEIFNVLRIEAARGVIVRELRRPKPQSWRHVTWRAGLQSKLAECILQSPFAGATSPFGTSPRATSPFYDYGGRGGPTSPTYSPPSLPKAEYTTVEPPWPPDSVSDVCFLGRGSYQ
jgi:hypothetical protein